MICSDQSNPALNEPHTQETEQVESPGDLSSNPADNLVGSTDVSHYFYFFILKLKKLRNQFYFVF